MLPRATVDDEWTCLDIYSNYASRPEARLLQSQGASRHGHGPFSLPNVRYGPCTKRYVLLISVSRPAAGPAKVEKGTHTSSSRRQNFSILPQIEVFLLPRVLPPDLINPVATFQPNSCLPHLSLFHPSLLGNFQLNNFLIFPSISSLISLQNHLKYLHSSWARSRRQRSARPRRRSLQL